MSQTLPEKKRKVDMSQTLAEKKREFAPVAGPLDDIDRMVEGTRRFLD